MSTGRSEMGNDWQGAILAVEALLLSVPYRAGAYFHNRASTSGKYSYLCRMNYGGAMNTLMGQSGK